MMSIYESLQLMLAFGTLVAMIVLGLNSSKK